MKPVVLSADCPEDVFLVPDIVADHLRQHCLDFCGWLRTSEHAKKYRRRVVMSNGDSFEGLSYTHFDFIEYLNAWLYPDQPSVLVGSLDALKGTDDRYEEYLNSPGFNF